MTAPHCAIEAVWRIESAKVIAGVARLVRDVGLAEELAQDALVAALKTTVLISTANRAMSPSQPIITPLRRSRIRTRR